eukprot:TRINITY_DN19365_c0_g1_i2.p1 TRINITY_DN19365_c0_g1~~TRINITY_DN19365_c0_g1_i2.p1  ORF type:complete len:1102 (+),score=313.46 TRINITY_DN19365_c0_g1_i2:52-3306(+)
MPRGTPATSRSGSPIGAAAAAAAAADERAGKQDSVRRPEWVDDAESNECQMCGVRFTTFTRRHHCRSCGLLFCFICTNHTHPLPQKGYNKPVRVCRWCKEELQGVESKEVEEAEIAAMSDTARLTDIPVISAPFSLQIFNHPRLRYVRVVEKVAAHKAREQKRALCIVDQFLILCTLTGRVRRVVDLTDVRGIFVQDVKEAKAVWQHDYKCTNHLILKVGGEIDVFVKQVRDSRNTAADDGKLVSTVQHIHKCQTGKLLPARQVTTNIRDFSNFANWLADERRGGQGAEENKYAACVGLKYSEVMKRLVGEDSTGVQNLLNDSITFRNIKKHMVAFAKEGGKEIMAWSGIGGHDQTEEHQVAAEVRQILERHDPLRLQTVAALLSRYKDREETLLHELRVQYEPETATKAMIVELVSRYDPDRADGIEELLAEHKQNEAALLERLQEHYAERFFPEKYAQIKAEEEAAGSPRRRQEGQGASAAQGRGTGRRRGMSRKMASELQRCLSQGMQDAPASRTREQVGRMRSRMATGGSTSAARHQLVSSVMKAASSSSSVSAPAVVQRIRSHSITVGYVDSEYSGSDRSQRSADGDEPLMRTVACLRAKDEEAGGGGEEEEGAGDAATTPRHSPPATPRRSPTGPEPGAGLSVSELKVVMSAPHGDDILRVYLDRAPERVCALPGMLKQHAGREHALLCAVRRHYRLPDQTSRQAASTVSCPTALEALCGAFAAEDCCPGHDSVVPGAAVWLSSSAAAIPGVPPGSMGIVQACSGGEVVVSWPGAERWQGRVSNVSSEPPAAAAREARRRVAEQVGRSATDGGIECGALRVCPAKPSGPRSGVIIQCAGTPISGASVHAVSQRSGDSIRIDFPDVGETVVASAASEDQLAALFRRCGVDHDLGVATREGGTQLCTDLPPCNARRLRQIEAAVACIAAGADRRLASRCFDRLAEWSRRPPQPSPPRSPGPDPRPAQWLALAGLSPPSPKSAGRSPSPRRHPSLPPQARGKSDDRKAAAFAHLRGQKAEASIAGLQAVLPDPLPDPLPSQPQPRWARAAVTCGLWKDVAGTRADFVGMQRRQFQHASPSF